MVCLSHILMWGSSKLKDNLRILFITYTHSGGGGAETVLTTLVNHLPKNWQIDILETLDMNRKKEMINPDIRLFPALTKQKSKAIDRMLRHILFFHPEIIKGLRGLYGYDVVISWIYRDASFMLPAFPECKRIAWFHGMVDDLLPFSTDDANICFYKQMSFRLQKKACACADRIVEISNKTKESVMRVLPEFSDKLEVVYNGVDIEKILHLSEMEIADADAENIYKNLLNTREPILISIGRLDHNKNFSLALQALSLLKEKGIFAYYLLIGKGFDAAEEQRLRSLVDEYGLDDRVFFLGFQSNPYPFLKSSKLLLVTSLEEGFSMVAAESMAFGVPFVTTPVAGASEELANAGKCGLVSDWDAEEYARKVETLLKDEALYKQMSVACKEHVKTFSVQSAVNDFSELLEAIPAKSASETTMSRRWALLLFITYTCLGYVGRHAETLFFRFRMFKRNKSLLNICKLSYRLGIFLLSFLCFPLLVVGATFLSIKHRDRLFGYE